MSTSAKQVKDKRKSKSSWRSLYYYKIVVGKHKAVFLGSVLTTLGHVFLISYANPILLGLIVDTISTTQIAANEVIGVFGPYILMFALANIAGQACAKLQDYFTWKMQILCSYDLFTIVFDELSQQSMTFHSDRFGGALVSQAQKFSNSFIILLENFIYTILPVIASVVYMVVLLVAQVPLFVVILSSLMAIYLVVAYLLFSKVLPINAEAASAQNALSGVLSDSITNILSVKTYGREEFEHRAFDEANRKVVAIDSKRMRVSTLRESATSAIVVVIMVALAFFLCGGNAWFGVAPSVLVLMFTCTYTTSMMFNSVGLMMQQVVRALGDAQAMVDILESPRLVDDKPNAPDLVVTKGQIEICDLCFSYSNIEGNEGKAASDGGTSASKSKDRSLKPSAQTHKTHGDLGAKTSPKQQTHPRYAGDVFDGLNLTILAGQKMGLVGKSGSGKTTLTNLILRLNDIQGGQILIDGQNIADITQTSLRHQIAYVPQEPMLFHRSIKDNIAYGNPDASEEQILNAARMAEAVDFIEALPEGFETITGERGVKLSGGQRQRIAIARAILADAPILILDEATSALDSQNEQLVQNALANLMQGRTSIVVAHRLSTVASLDRIVVLDQGKIVEDGTHDELICSGGVYAEMWKKQTGGVMGA